MSSCKLAVYGVEAAKAAAAAAAAGGKVVALGGGGGATSAGGLTLLLVPLLLPISPRGGITPGTVAPVLKWNIFLCSLK